ncbi:MFS transporter [Rubrobacter taiwanensis]|jgi:predicted MFS family arabinose efflux permease|uniref:MFS transporter n=1 Tax=Rubrobacter taiwanensis TaxID=185139 RepID=A0A4R1BL63_9ACTN|nr:MFS transporter [Rubrobacter taiwanensis]TCJ18094.1 MFS transporter [Rubrobacter taiwanensis]
MNRFHIFGLFTFAYFLSYFFRSANAVIAPDLSRELALDAAQLGLMTSVFFAAFALAQLPVGLSLDRWGPRPVVPVFMAAGVAGSLVFAAADSFPMLILGRALLGVGMAVVLMGSFKVFSLWFPPHQFATVSGILMGVGASGALFAATPLAYLNETFGWRAVFAGGALVIAASALVILIFARNAPPGAAWPSADSNGDGLMRVFGSGRFWRIAALNFFMCGGLLGIQGLWAGPYLYDAAGLGSIAVGNLLLLMGIGVVAGYGAIGWLADRLGVARVVLAGCALFALCQLALALRAPLALLPALYFLFGFFGGAGAGLLIHARTAFPPGMTARAVSMVNLAGIAGTFLLQWLIGVVVDLFPADAAGRYPPEAYTAAFLFTAAGTAAATLFYLPLARKTARTGE